MNVLAHFEAISQIPRGSGNEKAVSDYVADFARGLGLETIQDKWNNLIIFKPGTPGYESKDPVILQAHLDMVCEKNADTVHDFTRDPIKTYIDGDFMKARGTTLGADNGIGVALCMAFLQDGEAHPPLEIVLTTDEETGMDGAENLDMSQLKGRRLINLDTGDETTFVMGCAAGTTAEYTLPAQWTTLEPGLTVCEIYVKGLKGGHSGEDIKKERGNALRILGHLLASLGDDVKIAKVSGGMKVNAIPRESEAIIAFTDEKKAEAALEKCRQDLQEQFRISDSGLCIEWKIGGNAEKILTHEWGQKVVSSLLLIPTGVEARSLEIDDLVNASCNLGVVETSESSIKMSAMVRGAAELYNRQIERQIAALAKHMGADIKFMQRSPAWPFNPESKLLKTAVGVYSTVFKREPKFTAIHGGLECGLFSDKIPGIDIVSFGPDTHDLHTPDERLSLSSTARVCEFLQVMLREL